ncbi:unnamed protein product [Rhizoctonia solani]|uniref:Uncharacterized protein n=1 Tax=Rhizoctonia solani TaxID=456999 RepID=A0A8H3BPH1_9AGAM|nr:unnamed protein product [Rhizoctonia solani]
MPKASKRNPLKQPKNSPKFVHKHPNPVRDSRKEHIITKIKPPPSASIPANSSQSKSLGDYRPIYDSHTPKLQWIRIVADFVMQYCPERYTPPIICLLPSHPLVVTIIQLIRKGLLPRSIVLLDRVCRGRRKVGQELGALFFSPRALEALVDASLEFKARRLLPLIVRELSRTHSTQPARNSPLARSLVMVYEKLMNLYYQLGDFQSVLSLYSASYKVQAPTSQIMFKRVVQSLFKRFLPSPSDLRRYSIPRSHMLPDGSPTLAHQQPSAHPPIDAILEQLRRILNHMASENLVPSSRLLADIFRGLGTILKLETQGVDADFDITGDQTPIHEALGIPAPRGSTPAFRLENLILDKTTWSTVGRIINNILDQTMDSNNSQQPGNEGQMMLLMAWADVMLSLREDIADAIVRATGSRSKLKALANRVNELLSTNQAWNYQRTFDRLARTSSLRPHHENSFGEIGSELDPALDLPLGPAPGQWPISRTLNEAQRISLLVRDRLVEGDSVAAVLHFHSLASLCGAFRRLCDATNPEDAPSLFIHSPGHDYQRPPEVVLAEVRQELEVRVEGVYVRLAGHALRTGDSSYVNDVLELAYTLPPRDDKRTFSRVWKRAMSAFVKWRTEWYGSGGVGRAFRTLAHLLAIKFASPKGTPDKKTISHAIPRAMTDPSRELFDLGWLREKQSWPELGRNVFARHYVVSALIEKAEKTTSAHFRTGARPNGKTATSHLQDAQRLSEEAMARKTIRGERGNHPRSLPRSTDHCPRGEEPGIHAREEATNVRGESGDHTHLGDHRALKYPMHNPQDGATPIGMLFGVLGALKVPMAASEAERLGYYGPRHESNTIDKIAPNATRK